LKLLKVVVINSENFTLIVQQVVEISQSKHQAVKKNIFEKTQY